MLTAYQTQTQQLLQNPSQATMGLYATSDITSYINRARLQVAGEGQCIRDFSTVAFAASTNVASYSTIIPSQSGIAGVLHVRQAAVQLFSGQQYVHPRPFEWFFLYALSHTVPPTAAYPTEWSQQGQGEAGNVWIYPTPTSNIVFNLDTVCYPIDLVDDTTVEVIPAPFTTAVPFFAAYLALLGTQSQARAEDAKRMLQNYEEFMTRARRMSTPTTNPKAYQFSQDPVNNYRFGQQSQQS